MHIERYQTGPLGANCYIVECGERYAAVDVGYPEGAAIDRLAELGNKVEYILLTHRHFDHVMGVAEAKRLTGAKVVIHRLDECGLNSAEHSLYTRFADMMGVKNQCCEADVLLDDGDTVKVGNADFTVIHTPGHTEGSVCFLSGDVLISGDTLFAGTIGRTDLPTGDYGQILQSLDRLAQLDGNTVVYPGHGEVTSIAAERRNNPYMNR